MLLINCPHCGIRDHSEFTYGSDASITYPALDAEPQEWLAAVYQRSNPKGFQVETWHHSGGCRLWLKVERSTVTHEITSVKCAHSGMQSATEVDKHQAENNGSSE